MIEKEMQELLWRYPERLLNEPLRQFAWKTSSNVGRADLVFEDRHGGLLIIEVKRGKLPREAMNQVLDYFGMMKLKFPDKAVEMMVVANSILPERRITFENRDIECREISDKKFRKVAAEMGYAFASEPSMPKLRSDAPAESSTGRQTVIGGETAPWAFGKTERPVDVQDFLSRCDENGKRFFAELLEAQKAAANKTKITWNHQSDFSMQFYFHRTGFAPIVWGFPAQNREGKTIKQRLDFPFAFSVKAGVPESFVNELGAALSSLIPFSGGGKRPSIAIAALQPGEATQLIETIFSFAVRSSKQ
jgi:Endonuclease NucS